MMIEIDEIVVLVLRLLDHGALVVRRPNALLEEQVPRLEAAPLPSLTLPLRELLLSLGAGQQER